MYEDGTILTLKTQRPPTIVDGPEIETPILDEEGSETGEVKREKTQIEKPFPYNRVKVVGASFISYSRQRGSEDPDKEPYNGVDAQGYIIVPDPEFGPTIDEPYGKLRRLYDISELPEIVVEQPKVVVRRGPSAIAGPSPEEVFAGTAEPIDEAPRTAANPLSPLEDPRPKTKRVSPLD